MLEARGRASVLAALVFAWLGCTSASPPAAVAPTTSEPEPKVAASSVPDPEVAPLAAPLPLSLVAPSATAVAVIEVARLRQFEVARLARAFALEIAKIDLDDVTETCGFDPIEAIDRIVISGTVFGGPVVAFLVPAGAPSDLLDCFAAIDPEAEAQPFGAGIALSLPTHRLWVAEHGGAVVMGERVGLEHVILGTVPPTFSNGFDEEVGIEPLAPPSADPRVVVARLSRDPKALVAVSNIGLGDGMFALPTLTITFAGDREELTLRGEMDVRRDRRLVESDLRASLRRKFTRLFEKELAASIVAAPLLRAVDEARIEVVDGKLRFEGGTDAVGVLEIIVNAAASREIARKHESQ
jgi:hypothetical protein